jgi:UDP-GlcNAc:undecaprenyl-phosphate/decaprenyl-phosphate GlcNAc-1-phosphate transferase
MVFPLVSLAIAFLVATVLTPFARRTCVRIGLVDHPDTHRKLHKEPVALCGGLVVLASLIVAAALMLGTRDDFASATYGSVYKVIALTVGAIAIVTLGVLDDRIGLRGRQKLFGQILICLSVMAFGFGVPTLSIFGWEIELGLLAIPVTLGWLLLSINSVNLIDGADGLCSSVGWIACASISALGWLTNNYVDSMVAAALAGSLLGFLFFNLPPAKVYLGDAGSMLIGLFLGVLSISCLHQPGKPLPILVPVGLLAIPLFDSAMAIVRRKLSGRSIFTVDRGHLHHNLIRMGIHSHWLVVAITVLSVLTCGGAVAAGYYLSDWISIFTITLALGSLIVTRAFGFAELELLCKRTMGFSKSLVARRGLADNHVRVQKVRLQGSREWDIVWTSLVEFAAKYGLARIALDLNMPWLHEGFHANWHVNKMPDISERWTVKIPIQSEGKILGRVEVVGKLIGVESYEVIEHMMELLIELQPRIESVLADIEEVPSATLKPVLSLVRPFVQPSGDEAPTLRAQ